jgi:anaerobic selenocysteine-containing dehydrogenase
MRAFVTDNIMAGFVYAPVGGGGPQGTKEWQEANVNELTDHQQYDPISGFPVYKTLLCEIKKKKRIRKGPASADPTLGCGG